MVQLNCVMSDVSEVIWSRTTTNDKQPIYIENRGIEIEWWDYRSIIAIIWNFWANTQYLAKLGVDNSRAKAIIGHWIAESTDIASEKKRYEES